MNEAINNGNMTRVREGVEKDLRASSISLCLEGPKSDGSSGSSWDDDSAACSPDAAAKYDCSTLDSDSDAGSSRRRRHVSRESSMGSAGAVAGERGHYDGCVEAPCVAEGVAQVPQKRTIRNSSVNKSSVQSEVLKSTHQSPVLQSPSNSTTTSGPQHSTDSITSHRPARPPMMLLDLDLDTTKHSARAPIVCARSAQLAPMNNDMFDQWRTPLPSLDVKDRVAPVGRGVSNVVNAANVSQGKVTVKLVDLSQSPAMLPNWEVLPSSSFSSKWKPSLDPVGEAEVRQRQERESAEALQHLGGRARSRLQGRRRSIELVREAEVESA
eukprot:TRINITY_DN3044_c0_g1_i1.p1 TRINITY_DN3044_c0_g1~~TRINITY_DN3044_c0_g1_i1.p1  ORF type:complete len:326 (-),score=45.02 TRINITY_DN3044_c0_g1_i1:1907-2884(-)